VGTVKRGQMFTQTVAVYNLMPVHLHVMVIPTCGCAIDKIQDYNVGPLSAQRITVRYRLVGAATGPMQRQILLVYSRSGRLTKMAGSVRFTLT
jgi:hypothetical protein